MNQIKRDTCVFSTWFINLCDTQDQLFPVELSFFTGEVWKGLLKKYVRLKVGRVNFLKRDWKPTNMAGGGSFAFRMFSLQIKKWLLFKMGIAVVVEPFEEKTICFVQVLQKNCSYSNQFLE